MRTALPIGTFYLTEILVGLTDLAVVGVLGTEPLAVVGLGKTILLSFLTVGFAVVSVGTVIMAERPTAADCGSVVLGSAVVALPFVVIAVVIGFQGGAILGQSGYDAALVALFDAYAQPLAWVVGPAMLFAVLKNVLNVVDRTAVIIWLSVGVVLINLAGSVLLVHGVGSWDGMGVAGAAWTTVGVHIGAATILFGFVLRNGFVSFAALSVRKAVRTAEEVITLGWAAGAQQALESVLFVIVLYLLGLYSPAWLAAGTVVFAVMELNYAMSGALGEVLSARIAASRAAGGGGLASLLPLGAGVSGTAAAILALAVGFFAEEAVSVFSGTDTSPQARQLMADLLRWTAPVFLFDAWQIVFVHALRGLRHIVLPMVLSTGCYWAVGLGGGILLAEPLGLGAPGLWIGFCMGLCCAAILLGAITFTARQITSARD